MSKVSPAKILPYGTNIGGIRVYCFYFKKADLNKKMGGAFPMVPQKGAKSVTPAKAGVHKSLIVLDSRVRGNGENGKILTFYEFIIP